LKQPCCKTTRHIFCFIPDITTFIASIGYIINNLPFKAIILNIRLLRLYLNKDHFMSLRAAITGDIVGSTLLSKAELKKLMKELGFILSGHQYEFFRGDSFQAYIKSPEEALEVVLRMRTAAVKFSPQDFACDIKASIGLGEVKSSVKILRSTTEEAFVLSGRALDKLKPPQRLVFACSEKNHLMQLGLQIIGDFIDYIFRHLTIKQAAVLFELLQKRTQTEAAKRLKKSQATINRHAQAGGWPELEKLSVGYKQLLNTIQL